LVVDAGKGVYGGRPGSRGEFHTATGN